MARVITGSPVIATPSTSVNTAKTKIYRGMSTVSTETNGFSLYDIGLIKQDLINHFHIRRGEKLENPEFGTIIWDVLFDQLTESLKEEIRQDVTRIVNSDPRVRVDSLIVTQYEMGLQIECELTYYLYDLSEQLVLKFDRENGLIV